ncbi:MAG: GTP cyclohydrolase FolE2 [Kerstersia gyiorum]
MNAALPDVSLTDIAPSLSPLAWVGMQGIYLPITVAEPGCRRELHARADEQAFAALNGQNLMFVEDAARRIEAALSGYASPSVHVRHLESLHPHDAVVWAALMPEGVSA